MNLSLYIFIYDKTTINDNNYYDYHKIPHKLPWYEYKVLLLCICLNLCGWEALKLFVCMLTLVSFSSFSPLKNQMFQAETINDRRKLYFAVNKPNATVPQVSIEGGGVNASITTPNIIARNGVIHIIDRILGIPSQTVLEKLQSDPMLRYLIFLNWDFGFFSIYLILKQWQPHI